MVNTTLANSLLRRLHTQYVQHNIQYLQQISVLLSPDTDVFCTGTLLLGNVALTLVGIMHGIFL